MTTLLPAFAGVLLLAVLISGPAHRTVLSTAALFLLAGFVLGDGVLGVLHAEAGTGRLNLLAELALFAVLFTDGMRVGLPQLRSAWRLPGRALALGMPLTLVVTALLAHFVAGLGWPESFLVGAVLSPTDPVFAAAIVGRQEIPGRLRHLLNVESGVNDGLALPFVVVLLAVASAEPAHPATLAAELGVGVLIGIGVSYIAIRLERLRIFRASTVYEPLNAFAIGLLVLGLCQALHANLFLGAFSAGVTVATAGEHQRESFEKFGEVVTELLKLLALLVFGALITPSFLLSIPWTGWAFAVLTLLLARPVALAIALRWSKLSPREQAAAGWFGPKGFASVVYGILVLQSGAAQANQMFHLIALVVALSMLAHSSTDVLVARQFSEPEESPARGDTVE